MDSGEALRNPQLLARFDMLSFSDLKNYKHTYWSNSAPHRGMFWLKEKLRGNFLAEIKRFQLGPQELQAHLLVKLRPPHNGLRRDFLAEIRRFVLGPPELQAHLPIPLLPGPRLIWAPHEKHSGALFAAAFARSPDTNMFDMLSFSDLKNYKHTYWSNSAPKFEQGRDPAPNSSRVAVMCPPARPTLARELPMNCQP